MNPTTLSLLRSLIGSQVTRVAILVFPDTDGISEADVQLLLQCLRIDGSVIWVSFGTDSDGQSPIVTTEDLSDYRQGARLNERLERWRVDPSEVTGYELFDLPEDHPCHIESGDLIENIAIIRLSDREASETGIIIRMANGKMLYSAPGGSGNSIGIELADFVWPYQVHLDWIVVNLGT
jgi:hypothetical protein